MGDQEVVESIVVRLKRLLTTPEAVRCDLEHPTSSHHILWMCDEIMKVDLPKRTGWIGFLLGVMILHGLVDIDKEREIIRHLVG